ncbi:hypothetical protein [Enterococcus gilvus]|uniref:RelE/StbE family addiction module toxin n=1 Tax=Enterococcus gilvus ATCC BAA-350 TaxID=1158614 RepID=R2XKP6_9ENTE|nr:hypothetical protein [Enterococcus gilvus]EOI55474.1 hypothetical protein UKC_02682 [Enterococcus gilvus ATCC BAA-350]EOW81983.1 hypothetical protein I592_01284 [Enterococcus gilvus ATCC BAA-350]OJG43012.1 hypothetical protein RV02_GL002932 [Enterococcus gilvus]
MYQYVISNPERLTEEINNLLSFPLLREQIKEKLFERIISDAKENCETATPEQLFDVKEYGVWFHTVNYPEFRIGIGRYDTFVIYRCRMDDDRLTIRIELE